MTIRSESRFLWLLLAAGLLAYALPWVHNPGDALTLNAYDFAEWISKRPFDNNSYTTTFLLRGQLVLLTWAIMIDCRRPLFTERWWLYVIVGGILTIAQLPPLTFISNLSDANQQQQAVLAIFSLSGVIIGASGLLWRWRYGLWSLIAISGIAIGLYSYGQARTFMQAYALPAKIGSGLLALLIVYSTGVVMSGLQFWQQRR